MRSEMQPSKKSNGIKWTLTSIAFVLSAVLLVSACLQLFGKGKVKPSEWFKKADKPQAVPSAPLESPITYLVTYAGGAEDGSIAGLPTDENKYSVGDTVTVSSALPTRLAYVFDGWSNGTATYRAGDTITVSGDITLTAVWKAVYTVTFKLDAADETAYKTFTVTEGSTVQEELAKVASPEKANFRFNGWLVDGNKLESSYVPTGNVTVLADFTQLVAVEIGSSDNSLAFTGWTPAWTTQIRKGQVVTLKGTHTSLGAENFHSLIMYVYSGSAPTSILRSDSWFLGKGGENVDSANENNSFQPEGEAFTISKSSTIDWNTFKDDIKNAEVTVVFDYSSEDRIVASVTFVANNHTHVMTYTLAGSSLAESYNIGLGGEACHAVFTEKTVA